LTNLPRKSIIWDGPDEPEIPRSFHHLKMAIQHCYLSIGRGRRPAWMYVSLFLALAGTVVTSIGAPRVVGSSIQDGDTVSISNLTLNIVLQFDEEIAAVSDPSSVSVTGSTGSNLAPAQLSLSQTGSVLTATFINVEEDNYTLTLVSGDGRLEGISGEDLDGEALAFPIPPNVSGDGIQGGDFLLTFTVDSTVRPFPSPLVPKLPFGSLVYDPLLSAEIVPPGDTDRYTIALDAGQVMSVVAAASALIESAITVRGPGNNLIGTSVSGGPGSSPVIQALTIPTPGIYLIAVSGVGTNTGAYTLDITLNAAIEEETLNGIPNNTAVEAENIDASFISLPGGMRRAAVAGELPEPTVVPPALRGDESQQPSGSDFGAPTTDPRDHYAFTLEAGDRVSIVLDSAFREFSSLSMLATDGSVIAQGTNSPHLAAWIEPFVAPTPGTYQAIVEGEAGRYTLVVVENGHFEIESNNGFHEARYVGQHGRVLGAVGDLTGADYFLVGMARGDGLQLETFTPFDGPFELHNMLDPAIELYDPSGQLVRLETGSAPDGKNAALYHFAEQYGPYRVKVFAEQFSGEYLLVSDVLDREADEDGDGLSDAWEREHGLNPNDDGTVNIQDGALGDPDADGASNAEERTSGTNPNDSASVFAIIDVSQVPGTNEFAITFTTQPDIRYAIEFVDSFLTNQPFAEWTGFSNVGNEAGSWFETGSVAGAYTFVDNFSAGTSGGVPRNGLRHYRVHIPGLALFADPNFVHYDKEAGIASEGINLEAALVSLGYAVIPFGGVSASAFSTAVATVDTLVIPELERQSLAPALNSEARSTISNFVASGGTIIIHSQFSDHDEALINAVFGMNLTPGLEGIGAGGSRKTEAASGTFFEDTPDPLPHNDGTRTWLASSLPEKTAHSIYQFDDTGIDFTTVGMIPFGAGRIVFLAWDWYDGVPIGSQDGGWLAILEAATLEGLRP
jgi:hypothetical protein